jgi:Tfp pilus assembly protein, ATPase PilM
MFFAAKTKGYFVEQNDHATLLARTSAVTGPIVVEEVGECSAGDEAGLAEMLKKIQPKKSPTGYMNATCGVYPPRRLVRRASLELKRLKEAGYFGELLSTQFRLDLDKHSVHAISAVDGTDYDLERATQKEVLFVGMPNDDVTAAQDRLLAAGIYPDRLELGTVASLGAVIDYLRFKKSTMPTLVLEIGSEVTHSFIVGPNGVEVARPIPQGIDGILPVVQKELGLKDLDSAKKLFFSNTFDFTGMGPLLVKRLLKELQSSIGFYEVQTGQSVGQVVCLGVPPSLEWLDRSIASALGIANMTIELEPWLASRGITFAPGAAAARSGLRWFGLLSLMVSYNSGSDAAVAEKKK